MKNPRNLVIVVFLVVFFVSTVSVASIIKSARGNSFESFASGYECHAQGNFMPQPFESEMIAPVETTEDQEIFCSMPGNILPRPWDEEDDDGGSGN